MSKMPVRIQLRRTRGWRMPADTVKIDRTTKWGNPYRVVRDQMRHNGDFDDDGEPVMRGPWLCQSEPDRVAGWWFPTKREALEKSVTLYRLRLERDATLRDAVIEELRWKNLACWCAEEGEPCHGDVLLEIANRRIKP